MPHLGVWHDDAVYWISAKSLATGGGYRLLNLPGEPAQTKYPPLYPLLLSLVWRLAPSFPANAPWLMLLQWSMLPILTGLLWVWFRRMGFGIWTGVALTALVVLCPMTTMFATTALSELPFLIAVLGCLIAVGDGRVTTKRALIAGVCAAAAVLVRTNGIVLAAAIPLAMWRRGWRKIAVFLAPVMAAFAGWEIWCAAVRVRASSDLLSYYTDYTGFYRRTFSLVDLPHRLGTNTAALLTSIGRLLAWSTSESAVYRELCWFLTVLAFAGWIELWRRGARAAAWFAGLFALLLVVWNFPGDQRFAYPLLPFAAAGLAVTVRKVAARVAQEWTVASFANRLVAALMGGALAALPLGIALFAVHAYSRTLPAWMADEREMAANMLPVYNWIARETPEESTIAASDDPLIYLHTGRHAVSIAVLPAFVYEPSEPALAAYVRSSVRAWDQDAVHYIVTTPADFRRDYGEPAREAEDAALRAGNWRPIFKSTGVTVWAVQREARAACCEGDFGFSSSLKMGASTPTSIGPR